MSMRSKVKRKVECVVLTYCKDLLFNFHRFYTVSFGSKPLNRSEANINQIKDHHGGASKRNPIVRMSLAASLRIYVALCSASVTKR